MIVLVGLDLDTFTLLLLLRGVSVVRLEHMVFFSFTIEPLSTCLLDDLLCGVFPDVSRSGVGVKLAFQLPLFVIPPQLLEPKTSLVLEKST